MYEHNLYLNNLNELMAVESVMAKPDKPVAVPQQLRGEIRFEHVTFAYPGADKNALTDLSFTVKAGETLAVVGRNGAGKTTLFKLICRLYDPLEGRILIDGVDIRHYEPDELRRQIGAMFQDYVDYQATAAENIGLGNLPDIADREAVISASRQGGADELIANLPDGYDTALGKWFDAGVNLSVHAWANRGVHLAPLLDGAPRRPDHLPRTWAAGRGRHPRRADAPGRPLCRPVSDAGVRLHRRGHPPRGTTGRQSELSRPAK
jgi:ATP-binding cassette subfamily B protein